MTAGFETNFAVRKVEDRRSCLQINPGEVQVWHADLDAFGSQSSAVATLSLDEQARASRFRFERDRRRFSAGRHILRRLLGRYLEIHAGDLEFQCSAYGKPELSGKQANSGLMFNVSHSGAVALFAFALRRAVGVDVEQLRPDVELCGIAKEFFSESEQASLLSLQKDLQPSAFFACWTRKEAFVKAKGEGLSLPLNDFDVSLIPGQPARILATRPNAQERDHWSMWNLDAGRGFAAAVVVEGQELRLTLH